MTDKERKIIIAALSEMEEAFNKWPKIGKALYVSQAEDLLPTIKASMRKIAGLIK